MAVARNWRAALREREVALQEPSENEDDHLICGCRPHFSLCGTYHPDAHVVSYVDNLDEIKDLCYDCLKLWKTHGCGACGCKEGSSCARCWARYQMHQGKQCRG